MARRRASACFSRRGHPVERQAYFSSEGARGGRCRHASAGANEEALAKPSFEQRDLPADSAVGQPEFHSGFRIAARSSGDFEDAQSVQWKGASHQSVRKFDGLWENTVYTTKSHEYSFDEMTNR